MKKKIQTSSARLISISMILAIALIFAAKSYSQLPSAEPTMTAPNLLTQEGTLQTITSFSARLYESTVYFQWLIKGETESSTYIIERSIDGEKYEIVDWTDGYGTPNTSIDLLYCAKDENPLFGTTYYRIRQFSKNGVLNGPMLALENIPLAEPLVENDK